MTPPFSPGLPRQRGCIVIVGGAGFIGANLAQSFLAEGEVVTIVDNLSRPGVEKNLDWLQANYGSRLRTVIADVREPAHLESILKDAAAVYHFAAQVAVTTSLDHPIDDFLINGLGTLNVLEAVRRTGRKVPVIF